MLKVQLLNFTNEPERLVSSAARLCYSNSNIDNIREALSDEQVNEFVDKLISMGHESPLEHVTFTFGIEGVSRSLTHQLVRHRIASYSQQSQRYVNASSFEYVVPPAIEDNKELADRYIKAMEYIDNEYKSIADELTEKYIKEGMAKSPASKKAIEDARYLLPNACETKIICTMNVRTLLNFFKHRCCDRAQWEIRGLADEMLKLVKAEAPIIFRKAGPSCAFGKCSEGKMCCGKMVEMKDKYNNILTFKR